MINQLIKEINCCLDNGCYMSALTTTLILPDICGKAKYPEMEKQTKQRYIKWFDEYIGQFEKDPEDNRGMPFLSGELVYSLRCSILHQGNPNIDGEKLDINYFELLYQQREGARVCTGSAEAEIIKIDGKEVAVRKKYCVNVRALCWKICRLASYYFNKHKEKFNFFDYRIVNTDYATAQSFGLSEEAIKVKL